MGRKNLQNTGQPPQHGPLGLNLQAVLGWTPAKVRPPGARHRVPPPGLAPVGGPGDQHLGEGNHEPFLFFLMRGHSARLGHKVPGRRTPPPRKGGRPGGTLPQHIENIFER